MSLSPFRCHREKDMNSFFISLILLAVGVFGLHAQDRPSTRPKPPNAYEPVTDVPGLPRVLLIGDSISEGYTVPVRKLLQGKANVHRIPKNGGPARTALAQIDEWLGTEKWDVIHFNWGLHDLRMFPNPKMDPAQWEKENLALYEKNLRALVARLKQTGAKLIWVSSTPIQDETDSPREPPNRAAAVKVYNDVAAKIMKENGIPIDDLNAYVTPVQAKMQKPRNVHFSVEGSEFLAKKVAQEISAVLETKPKE